MKLTKENIKFIDTYLKNSEIEFADVRMEMVDHVSNAIAERMNTNGENFYNAFKGYMVSHKKELQKTHKKFIKITDIKVLKAIFRKLIKPSVLAIIPLGVLLLNYMDNYFDVTSIVKIAPIIAVIVAGTFYFIFFYKNRKFRFSGIERTGLFLIIPMQILQLIIMPENQKAYFSGNLNYIFILLFIAIMTSFMLVFIDFKKEYDVLAQNQIA